MSAAARLPAASGREVVQCARCGHACAAESWRARPTERTLTSSDLAACVVAWPDDAVVEVRGCPSCGAWIARRGRRT